MVRSTDLSSTCCASLRADKGAAWDDGAGADGRLLVTAVVFGKGLLQWQWTRQSTRFQLAGGVSHRSDGSTHTLSSRSRFHQFSISGDEKPGQKR